MDVRSALNTAQENDTVLLVAGDSDAAAGPFSSSLQVLETGVFEACGIRSVGVAGYPEGHPRIP